MDVAQRAETFVYSLYNCDTRVALQDARSALAAAGPPGRLLFEEAVLHFATCINASLRVAKLTWWVVWWVVRDLRRRPGGGPRRIRHRA